MVNMFYNAGIIRSYSYELMDQAGNDPTDSQYQSNPRRIAKEGRERDEARGREKEGEVRDII